MRIFVHRKTEYEGLRILCRVNLIVVTLSPQRCSKPARTKKERDDSESSRTSSLGSRSRHLIIVPLKLACVNTYDGFGMQVATQSYNIVVQITITDLYLRLPVYMGKPKTWNAGCPKEGPHFGYVLSTAGEHTGEDKWGKARHRIVANLVSGVASTPFRNRSSEFPMPTSTAHLPRICHAFATKTVAVQNAKTDPHLRIAVHRKTEYADRGFPCRVNLILATDSAQRGN